MSARTDDGRIIYVGVDGGGTKTLAQVVDADFEVLGEGRSGASNFLRAGLEPAVLAVERAVCIACLKAGVRLADVRAAGVGLAGVTHPRHNATMLRALKRRLPIRSLMLVGDAQAAVAGATDLEPGVVVISGTGSVAYGVDARGRTALSGGWGPVMGDEGSGHDIARRALSAVASALDGRMPETSLTARVCAHFGVSKPEDLPSVLYDPERNAQADLPSLAKIVEEEARVGDAVARSILEEAGSALGEAVVAVIRRLGLEESAFRVAYVGGVFGAGALVIEPMRRVVEEVAPRAIVTEPLYGPAIGAAKLAAQEAAAERPERSWALASGH